MIKRRQSKRVTLKSKGSRKKKVSRARAEILDLRDWKVGMIAWNRDGNVVILDPRVARYLRDKARKDHELEIGIPDLPVQMGVAGDSIAADLVAQPVSTVLPPQPLQLCGCEVMRFRLEKEMPIRTKLLSSEKMR